MKKAAVAAFGGVRSVDANVVAPKSLGIAGATRTAALRARRRTRVVLEADLAPLGRHFWHRWDNDGPI